MTRIRARNLESLARPSDVVGAPDTQTAFETMLDTLAATITDLDPDVLATPEVLDPGACRTWWAGSRGRG